MRLRWSASALDDRLDMVEYIGSESPAAAFDVDDAIVARAKSLLEMPLSGRAGRTGGTREAIVNGTPYILIYTVRNDVLRIIRVMHGARRWPPTAR